MACIDAAIIKALVEHIGMNPDDIPTAGGGGSSGTSTATVIPVTWSDSAGKLFFTIPEGHDIEIGSSFLYPQSDGTLLKNYCVKKTSNTIVFTADAAKTLTFTSTNGGYKSDAPNNALPDNRNSGLFTPTLSNLGFIIGLLWTETIK